MQFGSIQLSPVEIGSQGSAILGIRDSGKSYTATKLAELMFDAGIPFVAFDPIGVWRYLRVPGSGKGYPIVVAGGQEGDLPLSPASAPMIVEAAMKNGVSVVLDLFDINLSKADWRRIVRDCVRLLLHKNKDHGLRHVFLEEAAEFAPQRVLDGDVYAEIEKLARMGGNSRLGYTLINQRAQEVNKAVLELCDNLFLHRQKGKNALDAVKKWLEIAGAAGNDVMKTLPTLPQGECWAWLGSSDTPIRVKVPAKNSLHPDRRLMHGETAAAAKKAVKVEKFVSALQKTLPQLEEEAKANDPKQLRREIAQLQQKLAAAERTNAPAWPDQREEVRLMRDELCDLRGYVKLLQSRFDTIRKAVTLSNDPPAEPSRPIRIPPPISPAEKRPRQEPVPRTLATANGDTRLPPGEKAVLIAAVQYQGVDRDQLAVLTGYKRSSRDAYIARLREKGLVEVAGQTIRPTDAASDALGSDYEPLPTGAALRDYWMQRLPTGEAAILDVLVDHHPSAVARTTLDEQTGYKRSSRDAYIARLKARRLVEIVGSDVRASETLF